MKTSMLVLVLALFGCGARATSRTAPPHPCPPPPSATRPDLSPPSATRPDTSTPSRDGVEILVENADGARYLVVTQTHLYWIGNLEDAEGVILQAPHEQGAKPTALFYTSAVAPRYALDRIGDRLVWFEAHEIRAVPLTGGEPALIARLDDHPESMIDAGGLVVAAYDPFKNTDNTRILRISNKGKVTRVATLRGELPSLAVDASGAIVVATSTGVNRDKRGVVGRFVKNKFVEFAEPSDAEMIALDASAMYCVVRQDNQYSIVKVSLDAAAPTTLVAKGHAGEITALAVDDRHVYWAEFAAGGGKIWRLAKAGGQPESIADIGYTTSLVLFGAHMYWTDWYKNQIVRVRR